MNDKLLIKNQPKPGNLTLILGNVNAFSYS